MHFFSPSQTQLIDGAKNIYSTKIAGLLYIDNQRHEDHRGYYSELALIPNIELATGNNFQIKQINKSWSQTNVIRGFHAEKWRKLIGVANGTCISVVADIRPDSATFGTYEAFLLGEDEQALPGMLFLDEGLANSFLVLSGPASYIYCVDQLYTQRDPSFDRAISLFDQDLNVQWPIPRDTMILSERDANSTTLRDLYPEKFNAQ